MKANESNLLLLKEPFFIHSMPVAGMAWPSIPNSKAASTLGMLRYLQATQWFSPEKLKQQRLIQLNHLFQQACQHVPYYRDQDYVRFCHSTQDNRLMEQWLNIPLLTRQMIQQQTTALYHQALPYHHGEPMIMTTSGSTGQPVTVLTDRVMQFFFNVLTMRHYHWHRYDLSKKMAVIRDSELEGTEPPHGRCFDSWGRFAYGVTQTGPCHMLKLCGPHQQAEWVGKINPDYLLCYPTLLRELLFNGMPKPPHLKSVTTLGEIVEPSLRKIVRDQWGIPLVDMYSSSEVGYIALQCPESDHYHVQEESVFVEVLDEQGSPCEPGEIGRIVITSLHNFASPLIRYDIGDYAEVGEPCPCGRGLLALKSILGRQRNMLTLPNGEKRWMVFTDALPFLKGMQFQVIQRTLYDIEISLVCDQGQLAEEVMIPKLQHIFGYPFHITFHYVTSISRSSNGKYEDFKSLV